MNRAYRVHRAAMMIVILAALYWAGAAWASGGDLLHRMQDRISSFTLDNGLTFVVIERHHAPVASFVTVVDVGSVNEPAGRSGLAHMLEHMAFKGTSRIGTRNWPAEKKALAEVEKAYSRWWRAKNSRNSDPDRVQALKKRFQELQKKAKKYVKPNEFASIIEANGGTDLNAATTSEYTMYFCSLPSNRAELWFSLESERLRDPVWREFFTEKNVVLEERRMRVDSNPTGRLMERLLALSYVAHPYRRPVIGWASDVQAATPSDLTALYKKYYIPSNIVCAVAGDVDPKQVRAWATEYFQSLQPGPKPSPTATREPEQTGTRRVTMNGSAQPLLVRAYHGLSRFAPQDPALELASDILSHGRTSRLYTALVDEKGLAAQIGTFSGYPADIDPGLFVVFAVPNAGVPLSKLASGIDAQIERMRTGGVTNEELQRVKTQARAGLIRGLDSNLGLAKSLAKAQLQEGDWRWAFTRLDRLEQVQPDDIRQVVSRLLVPEHMTEARLVHAPEKQTDDKE